MNWTYYDADRRVFEVYHLFAVDQETTCDTLLLCLQTMKSWSDAHRGHHPFLVLMEIKGVQTEAQEIPLLRDLEERILSVWPWERLIYPDLITGGEGSLKDALAARGWPVLGTVRGRGFNTRRRLRAATPEQQALPDAFFFPTPMAIPSPPWQPFTPLIIRSVVGRPSNAVYGLAIWCALARMLMGCRLSLWTTVNSSQPSQVALISSALIFLFLVMKSSMASSSRVAHRPDVIP